MIKRSFTLADTVLNFIEGHAVSFVERSSALHLCEPYPRLSKPEFEAALRDALRFLDRPEALRQNPLLHSKIVTENTQEADATPKARSLVLQHLIRETVIGLQGHPKRERGYRALRHTYLQPVLTQEKAAEILDLPFSTYRRHLAEGIALLTETLWLEETDHIEQTVSSFQPGK